MLALQHPGHADCSLAGFVPDYVVGLPFVSGKCLLRVCRIKNYNITLYIRRSDFLCVCMYVRRLVYISMYICKEVYMGFGIWLPKV